MELGVKIFWVQGLMFVQMYECVLCTHCIWMLSFNLMYCSDLCDTFISPQWVIAWFFLPSASSAVTSDLLQFLLQFCCIVLSACRVLFIYCSYYSITILFYYSIFLCCVAFSWLRVKFLGYERDCVIHCFRTLPCHLHSDVCDFTSLTVQLHAMQKQARVFP